MKTLVLLLSLILNSASAIAAPGVLFNRPNQPVFVDMQRLRENGGMVQVICRDDHDDNHGSRIYIERAHAGVCDGGYLDQCRSFRPSPVSFLTDGQRNSGSYLGPNNAAVITLNTEPRTSVEVTVDKMQGTAIAFFVSKDGINWARTASGYHSAGNPAVELIPAGYRFIGVGVGQLGETLYEISVR